MAPATRSINLSLLIEKLKLQIARFKRTPFGPSSARYPGELMQLEWWVDDLQANQAQTRVAESDQPVPLSMPPAAVKDQPRRTLPPHLPRQRMEHLPSCTCSNCGATMVKIGEDVSRAGIRPRLIQSHSPCAAETGLSDLPNHCSIAGAVAPD